MTDFPQGGIGSGFSYRYEDGINGSGSEGVFPTVFAFERSSAAAFNYDATAAIWPSWAANSVLWTGSASPVRRQACFQPPSSRAA